jgi:hypothetical protein
MSRFVPVGVGVVLACIAACNRSPQEKDIQKNADQIEKSAGQMQKGAEDMAKGLADMAKGLSAMAGTDPSQKPVDPVSFKDLQTLLPNLSGWEKAKPTGERMTSPVNYAEASVTFEKGDAHVEEKIVDSAFNQLLVAPFSMFLTMGYEKETEDGYEKALKVNEYPGWEKWNSKDREGELNAIVNKRFIVQIEGRNIDNPKVLHALMDQTDLKKLAAMK